MTFNNSAGMIILASFIIGMQKDGPCRALFVFSMVGSKQNAGSLLTPVSDTVFNALSHGTLGFAPHGSYYNHFLIGRNTSTANQAL